MCGALQYEVTGEPLWVAHCHCKSCRRNTGAPVATFIGFRKSGFRYLTGEPKVYHSSPGVSRSFCPTCGNPMSYESERFEGEIHIYLSTLDEPEKYQAQGHVFTKEAIPWFHIDDDLPRYPETAGTSNPSSD